MASSNSKSQIFGAFRAIGFCCNHVPFSMKTKGTETFVVTAVGRTFHYYQCDKLRLVFVGNAQPEPIQCVALNHDGAGVFAAYKNVIKLFVRATEKSTFLGHEGEVHTLLPFGDHLLSIDSENCFKIWDVREKELYGEAHFDPATFLVTCAVHPSTYLNKILLGSRQGAMQLWNVHTNAMIYTFKGWGSAVMSLVQSTAIDVVGVGLESGCVLVHNLRYDETLMKFQQDWGPVTAISFRQDGINTVASASPSGHIAVWDLDKRQLCCVMRSAHNGAVTGMQFLASQPLMVTSGPDNAIRMWIFDQSDGSARLLRSRCGHSAPPMKLRYLCPGGRGIMSAGLDNSLRIFSVTRDVELNAEFSQGALMKKSQGKRAKPESLKLPPIVDFVVEDARRYEWDSIVSCHVRHKAVHTWNLQNKTVGKHSLVSIHFTEGAKPSCVCITACGNFAVVGMTSGHVEMFNMQSGLHRGEFGGPQAHTGCVRGVAVDGLNMEVFSGGADKTIKFWSFYGKKLLHSLKLESPVSSMVYHRESSMLAVSCDNFDILVVDTDTKRVVRKFSGHGNRIMDMAFSPDARWLVSSSMDCTIRTWDLPSGRLIDYFLVESPATSISFSPTGDFLATSHVDDLGIYLWCNRSVYSHLSLRPLPADFLPHLVDLPSSVVLDEEEKINGWKGMGPEEGNLQEVKGQDGIVPEQGQVVPISKGLLTLSALPKSRWHNLELLDTIRLRNKPIEPPKQPKEAPFFLPTLPGLEPKFIPLSESDIPLNEPSASRIINLGKLKPATVFARSLKECVSTGSFGPAVEILKGMGPAAIEGEIRGLSPEGGGSVEQLEFFVRLLLDQIKMGTNFELVEAYMGLFLKLHLDTLTRSAGFVPLIEQLLQHHKGAWQQLQTDMNRGACLLGYCRSATV